MEQHGQQSEAVEAIDLSAEGAASSSDEQSDQISQGSNYCSYCTYYYNTLCESIRKKEEKKSDSEFGQKLLTTLPKECLESAEEMLIGLLDDYFLKPRPNIGPLSPADCIGENFENCRLFQIIKSLVTKTFPDTQHEFISKVIKMWFYEQMKIFTAIKTIEIVDFLRPDALYRNKNNLEILLTADCKRNAEKMVAGILDSLYNRFSVGFICSWGSRGEKLSHLYVVIHNVVSARFPETEDDIEYSKLVRKWYQSKFPSLNPSV